MISNDKILYEYCVLDRYVIDDLNILQASLYGMRVCIEKMAKKY